MSCSSWALFSPLPTQERSLGPWGLSTQTFVNNEYELLQVYPESRIIIHFHETLLPKLQELGTSSHEFVSHTSLSWLHFCDHARKGEAKVTILAGIFWGLAGGDVWVIESRLGKPHQLSAIELDTIGLRILSDFMAL